MEMGEKERLLIKNSFDGSLVYGTRKFNKNTGRNSHIDMAVQQASDFFIDSETGNLKSEMAEHRSCPVCNAKEQAVVFTKDGFCHVKCQCGFIFVNPTASDIFRDRFFSEIYETWTGVLQSKEQEALDRKKFSFGMDIIESFAHKKGRIVDIGAGTGLFLDICRERGWDVSGVEFNKKAVGHIRSLGIEVFDQPLEHGIYKESSLDCAAIWEVLEHINDPTRFLDQIKAILKPGGLLFVCVPNVNSLVTRILHEKARTFGGSSHVNFFSIETLKTFLENQGFEVLESDTMISELGTIKNHLSFEEPYSGVSDIDWDFLTPEYLYDNNLGSRIIMLARMG